MSAPDLTTLVRVDVTGIDGVTHELDGDTAVFIVSSLADSARPQDVTLLGAVRAILRREAYWLAYTFDVDEEPNGWRVGERQAMRYIPMPPASLELYHDPSILHTASEE